MSTDNESKQGHVGQIVGLVSTLGRAVKSRIGEFATEADEELRKGLSEAKQDLDEELADMTGEASEGEESTKEP